MPRKTLVSTVLAVSIVLAGYVFLGSGGTWRFPSLSDSGESRYADLAAGFAKGHLYLAHDPDPRLGGLPNPWDEKARGDIFYLWDASYLNGHYYLYHSPLPALIFHLPYRLLVGAYPSDALAVTFFSAWAFLAAVVFVKRALSQERPLALWVLLIGFGNVIPWALAAPRVYEVSITTGMAMSAMWALAMLGFAVAPTAARAANVAIWLALAIAARPNLGVLLFVTAAAVLLQTRARKTLLAFVLPLVVVGTAMIAYNVARFGEPFEFGVRYQFTHGSMFDKRVCGVSNAPEVGRLMNHALHYVFAAPVIHSKFPFVDLPYARLDPETTWKTPGGNTEPAVGIAPLIPLTIVGTLLGVLLFLGLDRGQRDPSTRAALQVLAGGWLVLLGLSSCWWVVARYALDFMLLIVIASIVCLEAGVNRLEALGIRILPLRIAIIALACYSIVIGALLGFMGPGDAFGYAHPELFGKISGWFHR